jgi:chaperonin GroES
MDEIIDAFPGEMTPALEGPIIDPDTLDGDEPSPIDKLFSLANKTGDFSEAIDVEGTGITLAKIGQEVVEDYERDKSDRREWEEVAKDALTLAAQSQAKTEKTYPWKDAANVRFPLLTTAALQFNARSYPAIVKGDEAISVKVVGQDRGRPLIGPDGQPMAMGPQGPIPASVAAQLPPEEQQQLQPAWQVPPGGKAERAHRVAEYLNTVLFYRMEDWESDTDALLIQLPVVGCAFRKIWYDAASGKQKAALVPALRIFVPAGARSCDTTPRLTEELPDVYPHEIASRMRAGYYRDIILNEENDDDGARLLLEQHRLMDLDEDGLDEPYIVTVDHVTQRVLRIEANFSPEDVVVEGDRVMSIGRGKFFVKYDFFPHPEGKFYGIGLGHLLKQMGDVVDTAINQLIDAGTAQTAGGGFIASGVRLQARGGSTVRYEPGTYRTVDGVSGSALREAIVERTLPNVSPVTFQVLDLILGAARDISGVKDVITGEASNTGQVGTTLALIEQGLQVFNAVYKRIYRSLKDEFALIYRNVSKFGGEAAAKDYAEVMDDPNADFAKDFNMRDLDIRPVSDPSSVTRMQKMARAQFLMGTVQMPGANPLAILKRVYEAADVENPDELLAPPPQPDPKMLADAQATEAKAFKDTMAGEQTAVETELLKVGTVFQMGQAAGMA